jgi:hypothetical protein
MGQTARYVVVSLLFGLDVVSPLHAADPIVAAQTTTFTSTSLGLTVVATEVNLPAGQWEVTAVAPASVLEQVFPVPQAAPEGVIAGRRVGAVETERSVDAGRGPLFALFQACRDYAVTHEGRGPDAFGDLDAKKYAYVLRLLENSPWPQDRGRSVKGPFYFLVPGVPIPLATAGRAPTGPGTPLALELRPFVDDGKHWVLLSDGRIERRPIDPDLVAKHHLAITFVRARATVETAPVASTVRHDVWALLRSAGATAATLSLTERATGERIQVRWNLGGAQTGAPLLLGEWARARAREWAPLAGHAPLLHAWAARTSDVYGGTPYGSPPPGAPREPTRSTDAFSILGGRAALRETLQLELLRQRSAVAPEAATVPLATITGVEVKSHPFGEMLAGKEGGRLPLADHVPADRFFVYLAKPAALFPLLEQGGDFLFRAGGLFSKSVVDDDLKGRYLRRLGLGEGNARRFIESGGVVELALVTPDLFFIDGTDVTVLMRVREPDRLLPRMKDLGIVELRGDAIAERVLASGRSAYWARRGDLLAVSTSRAELDAVLAVGARPDAGSLGRSAEFRYMLTQLPLKPETRALIYLSDPFIRRMVGPGVKIGQLRRMRARTEMELITAGALLSILDGARRKPELERLVRLGYVPGSVAAGGYRLRDDLSAVSPLWGPPAEMAAIGAVPVDKVTASEAQAYRAYVDEYSRYWRQYFDPVAMRLDDVPGGALELSTFILPLLDSQLYDQVRGFLATREGGAALRVPVVTPDPVFLLSLNLTEAVWTKISGSWSQLFSGYTGISPAIFDRLGPGLHVAVQDADPIIVLGNADILGSFAGPLFTSDLMAHGLPLLLAVLTRPCKILVELQDEKAVLDILRRATRTGSPELPREMRAEFRQVEGRNAWIYALNVAGIVKIRFGIEVKNGYLVLSNIPWSQPVTVKAVERRALNGAELQIAPGAVRLGLPGLFAAQSELHQLAALSGMAALYPLLLTVSATPEDAAARHAALFGAKPLHPGSGKWIWKDGKLESSAYGTATRWTEPVYKREMGDFGLFEGVTRLSVNMQLEAGGLRAVSRWTWKGK